MNVLRSDPQGCRKALGFFVAPGSVVELRALKTPKGTVSGYFSDLDAMTSAAMELSGDCPAVYFTPNPVQPALLARASNRLVYRPVNTTSDADVLARRWLLIDVDPVRPAGISASDEEHEIALAKAKEMRGWLFAEYGMQTVLSDSGNGGHLMARIDLPNDDPATKLVSGVLRALSFVFDDERVRVDQTTFNAARIWKLPGTLACKGEHVPDRPHRRAGILEVFRAPGAPDA